MPKENKAIVKAFIKTKDGTIQLEGPQEFVEKYLNPIVKKIKPFSKAFPKSKPKTVKEQRLIKTEKEIADVYYSLSFGLIAATLTSLHIGHRGAYIVALILTIAVLIIAFYLRFFHSLKWKREKLVKLFSKMQMQMKYMTWGLSIEAIGISLINMSSFQVARTTLAIITWVASLSFIAFGIYGTMKQQSTKAKDTSLIKQEV